MHDVTTPYLDMLALNLTSLDLVTLPLNILNLISRDYHMPMTSLEIDIFYIKWDMVTSHSTPTPPTTPLP